MIPAPWVATSFYRWMVSRTNVPGRPNFAFNGQVGDIWYVFIALSLMTMRDRLRHCLQLIAIPVEAFLSWMIVRWIAGISVRTASGFRSPSRQRMSYRLASADVHLGRHHHWLGLGHDSLDAMDLPQYQRHAA